MARKVDLMKKAREFLDKKGFGKNNAFGFTEILLEEAKDDDAVGSYRDRTIYGKIKLNLKEIEKEAEERNISPVDSMIITLCHELGHHLEHWKNREEKYQDALAEMDMLGFRQRLMDEALFNKVMSELMAWQNGEQFVPKRLKHIYRCSNVAALIYAIEKINKKIIETEIKDYHEVMEGKTKQQLLWEAAMEIHDKTMKHTNEHECLVHRLEMLNKLGQINDERKPYLDMWIEINDRDKQKDRIDVLSE